MDGQTDFIAFGLDTDGERVTVVLRVRSEPVPAKVRAVLEDDAGRVWLSESHGADGSMDELRLPVGSFQSAESASIDPRSIVSRGLGHRAAHRRPRTSCGGRPQRSTSSAGSVPNNSPSDKSWSSISAIFCTKMASIGPNRRFRAAPQRLCSRYRTATKSSMPQNNAERIIVSRDNRSVFGVRYGELTISSDNSAQEPRRSRMLDAIRPEAACAMTAAATVLPAIEWSVLRVSGRLIGSRRS